MMYIIGNTLKECKDKKESQSLRSQADTALYIHILMINNNYPSWNKTCQRRLPHIAHPRFTW